MLSSKVEEAVRRAGLTSVTVYRCGRTLFMHVETQPGMPDELDR